MNGMLPGMGPGNGRKGLVETLVRNVIGTGRWADVLAYRVVGCGLRLVRAILFVVVVWPLLAVPLGLWIQHIRGGGRGSFASAYFVAWVILGLLYLLWRILWLLARLSDMYDGHGKMLPRGMSRHTLEKQIEQERDASSAMDVIMRDMARRRRR